MSLTLHDPRLPGGHLALTQVEADGRSHIGYLARNHDGNWEVVYAIPQPNESAAVAETCGPYRVRWRSCIEIFTPDGAVIESDHIDGFESAEEAADVYLWRSPL